MHRQIHLIRLANSGCKSVLLTYYVAHQSHADLQGRLHDVNGRNVAVSCHRIVKCTTFWCGSISIASRYRADRSLMSASGCDRRLS